MATEPTLIEERAPLADWLATPENEGRVARTRLKASDRVIARVTDGIYRQPSSALRELISNAWDADANVVSILTDAPRFSRIYVRDDGAGMTHGMLARLLHSIGGSAKRQAEGQQLGITAAHDPDMTPKGRPLIGKIGIGLFSVSQLSRRFRIITKVRGEPYRLIAEVRLRTYSENEGEDSEREASDSFINGEVLITREHIDDRDAHGTDVILDDIKPRVRDLLRNADRWQAIEEKELALAADDRETAANIRVEAPKYHSGWIDRIDLDLDRPAVLGRLSNLPWTADDPPATRMSKLVDAVEEESTRIERPDLSTTLDSYLQTIWALALSVPVRYVDRHPFDLTANDGLQLFWLSNETRGQAQEVPLADGATVREAVHAAVNGHPLLKDGAPDPAGGFTALVDDLELRRPIRFGFARTERRGLDRSMLFVGKYEPDLQSVPPSLRGGDLALEGYLFWNGRIVPKENNGVLVRIRGASGAQFDTTFFNYQVSEQTRLRQITSELFIQNGLDAALNIDRESFNYSHPHTQLVTLWLHRAIRQLTNRHKELSGKAREGRREEEAALARSSVAAHAQEVWMGRRASDPLPDIEISPSSQEARQAREQGYLALSRASVPILLPQANREDRDAKAKALLTVLQAYGVLDDWTYEEQYALIQDILRIFYDSSGA